MQELQTMASFSTQSSPHRIPLSPTLDIGGEDLVLIAGPCSVESYPQTQAIGRAIHQTGLHIMRGGAFKPRTSPHSFQGLGEEGLQILRQVADEFDLFIITEALGVEHLPLIEEYADIVQVGSRNMQHFPLLWAVGETNLPVMLKRGFMATIEEWLMAAEHIASRGNERIFLCERGIRTFNEATRNTFDISAIPLLKATTPFPVFGDPSHATGRADLVLPTARAALAAGADGLMVEVHPDPNQALSDNEQALPLKEFPDFVAQIRKLANFFGRDLI
jgi:3-deoxy-7-phosphoheptulonate synthase